MQRAQSTNRREFLAASGDRVCATALASLLARDLAWAGPGDLPSEANAAFDLRPRAPHSAPRARSVIHVTADGGPSQVDLFDSKPELDRLHGKSYFHEIADAVGAPRNAGALMRSPFEFAQYGQSGTWLSELLPHLSRVVDDIAVIRSMHTPSPAHPAAQSKTYTGRIFPGHPAIGAWVVYALGSETQDLPAYVALDDNDTSQQVPQFYHSGWLPPVFQATRFRSTGAPVLNLTSARDIPPRVARLRKDLLSDLDGLHREQRPSQPQLDARIANYELAGRMQLSASEALDIDRETRHTRQSYGLDDPKTAAVARKLLIARRLVERGVRFVQVFTGGWDNHNNLDPGLRDACLATDRPVAALLVDLKQRGLLDETLVLWGGEFGRLPIAQVPDPNAVPGTVAGRDHGARGYSVWLAGGGVKGGTVFGATDDIGFAAAENPVSVGDWHATMLHLLGLHHRELYFLRDGLRERLTGQESARVVSEILA